MEDQEVQMYLKTSEFYLKESKRLLQKASQAKTKEEKIQSLKELLDIKSRISREINEITKICEEGQD